MSSSSGFIVSLTSISIMSLTFGFIVSVTSSLIVSFGFIVSLTLSLRFCINIEKRCEKTVIRPSAGVHCEQRSAPTIGLRAAFRRNDLCHFLNRGTSESREWNKQWRIKPPSAWSAWKRRNTPSLPTKL
ncbi:unnamed protein product [Nesidiocoris tenuis]|uniref:Uncharacterized protein n=1 Tax=Nesidiocoris tenuis TaxID=355587 RepID=A0A6H5GXM1_9HEMI|nr:unnamed protein product [Nesidiocoris tenuis]